MDDLISRRDAIDALQKEINKGTPPFNDVIGSIRCGVRLARNIIEDLPSAQQWIPPRRCIDCENFNKTQLLVPQLEQQQWIPCSERMPECDYTDVLICVHDKRKGCEKDYYIISAYTSGRHWEPTLAVDMTDFDVVAWMPLPEPYEGEKE